MRGTPPGRLMCGKHWKHVPRRLQRDVWRAIRNAPTVPGNLLPTSEYADAAKAAIEAAHRGTPSSHQVGTKQEPSGN